MSHSYIIRPRAREDIDVAHLWYESQTVGRGDAFLLEVHDLVNTICNSPELYPPVRSNLRAAPLPRSKYIVYYQIEAGCISVLAVLHAAADPRKWKRRN